MLKWRKSTNYSQLFISNKRQRKLKGQIRMDNSKTGNVGDKTQNEEKLKKCNKIEK